jgi:UDP-N-acetylmuramate dehydrogenase
MNWFVENQSRFSGQVFFDEPLSKQTYYRIGGPAKVLVFPKTREDLVWIGQGLKETGLPSFILGAGSNVLVSDRGFQGVVVRASKLNIGIEARGNHLITGGSVAVSSLLRKAATEGWAGLEFLAGVPGLIGGVVRMNAGTHLGEAAGAIRRVRAFALDGRELSYSGAELKFQYRSNLFLPGEAIVWEAEWEIRLEDPAQVKATIDETLARRKATQPVDYPSCGSVFKNPAGHRAWQIVDQLGLRGHRIGDAQFAEKHSNFIINHGGARAADVRALIELARTRAQAELGVTLEEEVMYVGEF